MLSAPKNRTQKPAVIALLLAILMNAANLFEPVTVDDVCHHYYAQQVAESPLQPYEFEPVWHQKPVDGWTIMVAPVHSYYWAPGIWLFGDSVVGWHLWFLPVQWLFCFSLLVLLQRWLRRGAGWVTAGLALGPAILPGLNLMLEVPMLSLGLSSLAVLQRSFDRRSLWLAIGAGALWGVAFQTKYSAMAMFPSWFLVAFLRWRWREWAVGFGSAIATALVIEGLVSWSHGGGSFFMQQLSYTQIRIWSHLWKGMFQHVGLLAMPAVLLALVGLGARRLHLACVVAIYVIGLMLVAWYPDVDGSTLVDGAIDSIAYVAMSSVTWLVLGAMLGYFFKTGWAGVRNWRVSGSRQTRLFLVAWCLCEVIASFVVSPFPAARRVLMVVVALTASAAWLAVRRAGSLAAVRSIAVGGALLGLALQGVDLLESRAWTTAATGTIAYADKHHPNAQVYFTGGWGFEFYAPRAGLKPFLEGRSELRQGDLIAVGSLDNLEEPWFAPDPRLELVTVLPFGSDLFPLSTHFSYYSGQRPIDCQVGPRFFVRLLRAREAVKATELELIPDGWASRGEQQKGR